MSLFDEIKNAAGMQSGATPESREQHSSLINSVLQMFGNREGLSDLTRRFENHGLGDIVGSWIGTGANRTVDPNTLQKALGEERIRQIAQRAGLPPELVSQKLASVLPVVVDKLTPHGRIPEEMPKAS